VDEGIYQREQYGKGVADNAGPGRSFDFSPACKIDQVGDDRDARQYQTCDDQPDGEPLPHHIRDLPIDKISD
jgi:hypothetical protein